MFLCHDIWNHASETYNYFIKNIEMLYLANSNNSNIPHWIHPIIPHNAIIQQNIVYDIKHSFAAKQCALIYFLWQVNISIHTDIQIQNAGFQLYFLYTSSFMWRNTQGTFCAAAAVGLVDSLIISHSSCWTEEMHNGACIL